MEAGVTSLFCLNSTQFLKAIGILAAKKEMTRLFLKKELLLPNRAVI